MTEHRYICHHCDWNWPIHGWLPLDFTLACIAHRRHMLKCHSMRPVPFGDWGVKWVGGQVK